MLKSSKFNSANLKKIDAKKSKQEILSQFGIFFYFLPSRRHANRHDQVELKGGGGNAYKKKFQLSLRSIIVFSFVKGIILLATFELRMLDV